MKKTLGTTMKKTFKDKMDAEDIADKKAGKYSAKEEAAEEKAEKKAGTDNAKEEAAEGEKKPKRMAAGGMAMGPHKGGRFPMHGKMPRKAGMMPSSVMNVPMAPPMAAGPMPSIGPSGPGPAPDVSAPTPMRGGGIAKKGVGMALASGGMARADGVAQRGRTKGSVV